MNNP